MNKLLISVVFFIGFTGCIYTGVKPDKNMNISDFFVKLCDNFTSSWRSKSDNATFVWLADRKLGDVIRIVGNVEIFGNSATQSGKYTDYEIAWMGGISTVNNYLLKSVISLCDSKGGSSFMRGKPGLELPEPPIDPLIESLAKDLAKAKGIDNNKESNLKPFSLKDINDTIQYSCVKDNNVIFEVSKIHYTTPNISVSITKRIDFNNSPTIDPDVMYKSQGPGDIVNYWKPPQRQITGVKGYSPFFVDVLIPKVGNVTDVKFPILPYSNLKKRIANLPAVTINDSSSESTKER